MSKLKVFCFGFGQVAESFINKLISEKKDFDLSVTSRQETHQIEFNNIKINSIISASGIGAYPSSNEKEFDENEKDRSNYFLSDVIKEWEKLRCLLKTS